MLLFLSRKKFLGVLAVVVALPLGGYLLYCYRYPYGQSHCCILAFSLAFEQYAEGHHGHYPSGESSPEASLSLLYRGDYNVSPNVLRGKSVPLEVVQQTLSEGGLLGPETCGWHYVEGLTQNDDSRIAILWDKVGLGHFGERHIDGSREVLFLGGERRIISRAEWPAFLQEQERLLARRDEASKRGGPVLVAKVKLPTGELVDRIEAPYRIDEDDVHEHGSSHGSRRSESALEPSNLQWTGKDLGQTKGVKTLVLILPGQHLRSKPVKVHVENGRANPSAIVFEMVEER
jgi:hypothetical protein